MKRRRVLIVDDSEINRRILYRILAEDYDLTEAENGVRALEAMQGAAEEISAVLLDIVMPVMDGYEVLRAMRQDAALSQIPVIVTTGNTEEGAEVKALSLGANDFIVKPYNPAVIKHRLGNTINLRETAAVVNAATKDELTGLYNRKTFFEKAAEMIAGKEAGHYVLACMDIDNFKVVNDQYGSDRGDEVLKSVASVFQRGFDPVGGICCRITADNFAVLYPIEFMYTEEIERLRHAVSTADAGMLPMTISTGRYIVTDKSLSVNAMYDRAAIAEASVKGRYDVHVAVYDESMREQIIREQSIINEMNGALKAGQFEPWFQPQFNHSTGALIGAEALVRWRHPKRGMVPPNKFIPVFERNGFIYEMDKYIWERVCMLLRKWLDAGRAPLPVSVNISRYDLFREDFYQQITGLVERYQIPVELLRLEITESAFAQSAEQIIGMVEKLNAFGFTIEIDDFGSGYSSFNTLKDVPAGVLKPDMHFLEGSSNAGRGGNILESIVRMAKWLGMPVIAEGVETGEQADYLRSIGCNYVQGYLYAKPMPVEEYEQLSASIGREETMLALETVETLDNNAFWDPKSMETLIFNSYVGGACIFEYYEGKTELLRINEKYARALGRDGMSMEDALKLDVQDYMSKSSGERMRQCQQTAIRTGAEATCEVHLTGLTEDGEDAYLRMTMRVIARAGERLLFYSSITNITAQRVAERKEHQTAKRLQAIMDNVNGGITATIIKDHKPTFLFVNDQYFAQLGYTREQFEREVPVAFELIHPDDRERVIGQTQQASLDRTPFSCSYRVMRRDGSIRWMQSNISIADFPGVAEPVQLAVANDITRQMESENRMRELSEQLGAIMNSINGGISAVTIDEDNRVRFVFSNEQYHAMFGYTREQFEAEVPDAFQLAHPEDRARVTEIVKRLLVARGSTHYEYRCIKRSGEILFVRCNAAITSVAGISDTVLLSVITDITELVQAEHRINETSERLAAIMNNVNGGICAVTADEAGGLRYAFTNDKYYALLGYTREQYEAEVTNAYRIIHPDDRARVRAVTERLFAERGAELYEYRIVKRGGEVAYVRCNGAVTGIEGIGERVLVTVIADISKEKTTEQSVQASAEQLKFLNEIARRLLAEGNSDDAIHDVLEKILAYFGGERAYVVEHDYKKQSTDNTYEICAEGIEGRRGSPRRVPFADEPFWNGVYQDMSYISISDVAALPGDRERERRMLEKEGIRSLVAVPLRRDGRVIGFTGVDNPARQLAHIDHLMALGDYIAVMLTRRDLNAKIVRDNAALRDMLNDMPGGFARMRATQDNRLNLVYVNDGLLRLLDMPCAKAMRLYGREGLRGVHPDDRAALQNTVRSILETGETRVAQYRLKNGSGGYVWLMAFVRPTEDESGEKYLNVYFSELPKGEREALSARELLSVALSAMMESSSDCAFVKDTNFRYICCSRPFAALTNLADIGDVAGKTDFDLFESTLAERYRAADQRILESGVSLTDYVEQSPLPDGTTRYSSTSKYILRDAHGSVIGLYGVSRDITKSRRTYQRLKLLTDSIPGGLASYAILPQGMHALYMSEGLYALTGYTKEEYDAAAAQDPFFALVKEDCAEIRAQVDALRHGGESVDSTCRVHTKDGGMRWLSIRGVAAERHGEAVTLNMAVFDVTKRKLAEETARIHEEELKLAMLQMGKMICEYDVAKRTLTIPASYAKLYGLPTVLHDIPQRLGQRGILSEESVHAHIDFYNAIRSGQKTGRTEAYMRRADGGWYWESFEFATIFGSDGAPVKAIIAVEETTQQHKRDYEARAIRENEQIFRTVAAHSNRLIYRYDIESKTAYTDLAAASGEEALAAERNVPESVIEEGLVLPESAAEYRQVFADIAAGVPSGRRRLHMRDANGVPRWVDMRYTVLFSEAHRPKTAVISYLDITETHEKELAYERYRQSVEQDAASGSGLMYLEEDLTADVTEKQGGAMLPVAFPFVGSPRGETIDHIVDQYIVREERERCRAFFAGERLKKQFADGVRTLGEDWSIVFPDGRQGYIRSELQMVQDPYSGHIKAYTMLRDITQEKRAALDVKKQAEQDGMTGLYNKATTEALIHHRLAGGGGAPCALMIADLDNMKAINDTLGHPQGDRAICLLADVLKAQFRRTDIVGRIGGDEFLVFLEGVADEDKLNEWMASLTQKLSAMRLDEHGSVSLSTSIGVAVGKLGESTFDELYRQADKALYHVKKNGKQRYAFYSPEGE